VQATLRAHARARERWWVGLPLVVVALIVGLILFGLAHHPSQSSPSRGEGAG